MSDQPPGRAPPAHRLISAVPLGCGSILAAFLVTACGLVALTATASWIFALSELHQVVVAVILAAAAVVTVVVIATQVAVSFLLVNFNFAESADENDDDDDA
ncbi:MAG: hypothetical protein ACJ8H8_03240 [Geminicoccaceae bacterium]